MRRLSILLVIAVLAGCSTSGSASGSTAPSSSPVPQASSSVVGGTPLTILGAASLKGALDKAKTAYQSATPGAALTISTDSSAALETQIEQGAPADLFLSADMTSPRKLVDAGLASGSPVVFAGNKLTIIVPSGNPAKIASPADLAKPGIKVIAAGDEVPITKYATQLVANLANVSGYPPDFAAAYARNVVSKEDNVKAVVGKIELGEGDAAIVYLTDAKASTKVAKVEVPDGANVPASYAGVVVKASQHHGAATRFLTWLAGPGGQAILADLGFLPASG
jgi:molybdate transport system substrate-binding protein